MKWIKLYAYWGKNLGDDLMIEILLKRYPDFMFYSDDSTLSNQFIKFSNFRNRHFYYKKYSKLNKIVNLVTLYKKEGVFFDKLFDRLDKKCICSVYIGGSLYMQYSEKKSWVEDKIRQEEKKLCASPLYIIGANFGPIKTEEYLAAYKEYFLQCGGISFRDKASYSLFSKLPNIQYAPDVVFNLKNSEKENLKNNKVLISVINVRDKKEICKYADDYERFIILICRQCLLLSKIPVLVSFCEVEGDETAIQVISDKLNDEYKQKVEDLLYNGENIDVILHEFQKAEMIIATRFHAMVLAILYGKNFWAISYNEKVKNVLEDIGSNRFCTLDNLNTIHMDEIFTDNNNLNLNKYIKDAERQFKQLDEYLTGRRF